MPWVEGMWTNWDADPYGNLVYHDIKRVDKIDTNRGRPAVVIKIHGDEPPKTESRGRWDGWNECWVSE